MSSHDDKGRSDLQFREVSDFQSYRRRKTSRTDAVLPEIPSSRYIPLIHLTQRAEVTWCSQTAELRRDYFEQLDIRDRDGRPLSPGSGNISLLDLDPDFVAFRVAGLAAREDQQRRGVTELDDQAARVWDYIEDTMSCIENWDAFVEAVRAHGRSIAKPSNST